MDEPYHTRIAKRSKELVFMKPNDHMQLITFHCPQYDLKVINQVLAKNVFANRSELIRFAVKKLLLELKEKVEF